MKAKGISLFVGLITWLSMGCGPVGPPKNGFHVVVLGSSTAAGVGPAHPHQGWAFQFEHYLKQQDERFHLSNLAQPGYLSYQLMPTGYIPPVGRPWPDPQHNLTRALQLKPNAIILNLPSNDTDAGFSLDEQLHNLRSLADQASKRGIKVWVTTTQPRAFNPEKVALQEQLRDSIFVNFGDYAIDFWSGLDDCAGWPLEEYDSGDGTHLNADAHRIMFDRVREKVKTPVH